MIKKLKIGFLTYKIVDLPKEESVERAIFGMQNAQTQRIRIDASASVERRREVLLHEIIHAVYDQWMPEQVDLKDMSEETIVNALAIGLTTVFNENPLLKKDLFKG